MKFQESQAHWDTFAKEDPLWAILTHPSKKGGRWSPEEFFQTGVEEIRTILNSASGLKPDLGRAKALDFGCGVGRLTQALAAEFSETHGVDVSPAMIGHAEKFNRFPGRCHYHLNGRPDLSLFPDGAFDFIYSAITLQHIEARFSKVYVAEFMRILKPGGMAVFQVIESCLWRRLIPSFLVDAYRRWRSRGMPIMGMFGFPRRAVLAVVSGGGGHVLKAEAFPSEHARWTNLRYFVTKKLPQRAR
jgi:2-polyprenyl-3-methyl-5-hydroxy-6-metoxy-1,4-benzoquinol methylase